MRVAFRVDASAAIGLGHVKRCLALAHALRRTGAEIRFVMNRIDFDAVALVRGAGIAADAFPTSASAAVSHALAAHAASSPWSGWNWQADADETVAKLRGDRPDWVVVDHYGLDARWHAQVRAGVGARIVVIDDLADRALDPDLLVDHNLADDHRGKYRERCAGTVPMLAGPRYALLGPEYADALRYCASGSDVRSIGIFMGGADAADFSIVALAACRDVAGFDGPVEVATTSAHPQLHRLRQEVSLRPGTSLSVDLPSLAAFFVRHDLQIGAGGGATWERCCVGAPSLVLVAAGNQSVVVPALQRLGAVATLPAGEAVTVRSVGALVRDLLGDPDRRTALSRGGRRLVDGLGARRVALWLARGNLQVRRAREDDAETMLRWRNHPSTRAVSGNATQIDPRGHRQWLERVLHDPARCLFVGYVGDVDVGVIRFDELDSGEHEVSLYLDPALHGLGLGSRLLVAGETQLRSNSGRTAAFIATVLAGNEISQRMFAHAGYEFDGAHWRKRASPQPPKGDL